MILLAINFFVSDFIFSCIFPVFYLFLLSVLMGLTKSPSTPMP